MNLEDEIESIKAVQQTLERFLDDMAEELESKAPGAGASLEHLRWVLSSGGKRIRPVLCLLGHRVGGGTSDERILRVAASIELLHTFAIIHDDLMDQTEERRGVPTLFHALGGESNDAARPTAILVGDIALVLSEILFSSSGFSADELTRARRHLDRMRLDAVAGQYLDISRSGIVDVDVDARRSIARLKTGTYSVEGPLLIGATLAGADDQVLSVLAAYGRAVGEAFQLNDDLLLLRDARASGKDPMSDVRMGRPLVLISEAALRSGQEDLEFLEKKWGDPNATPGDLERIREIVEISGAAEASRKLVADLVQGAKDALADLDLPKSSQGMALKALEGLPARIET
ncbi:MAG: polyprenyl synthetase family protein [Actinobacteria bacterium]|nr:polyprenyl synthetase family protein [Actinomycetota bacterium]